MSDTTPKIKLFIFISIISLLINCSVCLVAWKVSDIAEDDFENTYTSGQGEYSYTEKYGEQQNITANDFALVTATSFLPFVDLVATDFVLLKIPNIDLIFFIFVNLIFGLFIAIKLFLLINIIANFIPFIDV